MYAENYDVKNIGICVFNSNWIRTCFGKPALEGEPCLWLCVRSSCGMAMAMAM